MLDFVKHVLKEIENGFHHKEWCVTYHVNLDEIGKTIDPVRAIKEYLISSQIDSDSINYVVKCNELTLVQDLSAEMKELLKEWFVDEKKINVVISDLINSGARVFSFGEDYAYIPIGNVGSVFRFICVEDFWFAMEFWVMD